MKKEAGKIEEEVKRVAPVAPVDNGNIKISNWEVFNFGTPGSQMALSFAKLQKLVGVSGRLQYQCYAVSKKILDLLKQVEEMRQQQAKKFCDKDEKDQPIVTKSPKGDGYKFTNPEALEGFNRVFNEMMLVEEEMLMKRIVITPEQMEDLNVGKPIEEQFLVNDMLALQTLFDFPAPKIEEGS